MKWTLPNMLTLLRIILIPVLVVVFYMPGQWSYQFSAMLFGLAALTDALDGYLARRLKQLSVFGAFLDPVADKLMVTVALVLLVQDNPTVLFVVPSCVIIGREIAISALREWMSEIGERTLVAVSVIGKVKTITQMVAILLLLYRVPIGPFPTHAVGLVLLYGAALLTLWSLGSPVRIWFPAPIFSCAKAPVAKPGFLPFAVRFSLMAGWQSGYAAACKAVYAGSIPASASKFGSTYSGCLCNIPPVTACPGGEIGRRKGLKIPRLNGRAGSIPAPGTIHCTSRS